MVVPRPRTQGAPVIVITGATEDPASGEQCGPAAQTMFRQTLLNADDGEQVSLAGPTRRVERRMRPEVLDARALAGLGEIGAEPGARVGRYLREAGVRRHLVLAGVEEQHLVGPRPDRLQHLGRPAQPVAPDEVVPDGETERAVRGRNGDDVVGAQREREHADVVEPAPADGEDRGPVRGRVALDRDRRDAGPPEPDREVALARTDVNGALDGLLADDREHGLPTRLRARRAGYRPNRERRNGLVDAVPQDVEPEPKAVEHVVDALSRDHSLYRPLDRGPAMGGGVGLGPGLLP